MKTADAIVDLIGKKTENKVTKNLSHNNLETSSQTQENSIEILKERYISP